MSFPPPFHTPRLSFVPINADEHAEAVFQIREREDVMRYSINHAPDPSVEATHAWLSRFNQFDQARSHASTDISPIGYVVYERTPPSAHTSSSGSGSTDIATTTVNGSIAQSTPTIDSTSTTSPGPEGKIHGRIIGTTALRLGSSPLAASNPLEKRWEIGYGFHPDAWGRGIATETVRGWIRVVGEEGLLGRVPGLENGFGSASASASAPGSEKVTVKKVLAACTDARNEASMRVLEKCGFVMTGEFLDEEGRGNTEFEYTF